jgi:hypothetical protein
VGGKCVPFINSGHPNYALDKLCGVAECTACKETRGCDLLDTIDGCKACCENAGNGTIIVMTGGDAQKCMETWECISLEPMLLCLTDKKLACPSPVCEPVLDQRIKEVSEQIKKYCKYLKK